MLISISPSEPAESASVPHETLSLSQPLQEGDLRIRCHEDLQSQAQQLVDDINAKRKRDTDLLNSKLFDILLKLFPFKSRNVGL